MICPGCREPPKDRQNGSMRPACVTHEVCGLVVNRIMCCLKSKPSEPAALYNQLPQQKAEPLFSAGEVTPTELIGPRE